LLVTAKLPVDGRARPSLSTHDPCLHDPKACIVLVADRRHQAVNAATSRAAPIRSFHRSMLTATSSYDRRPGVVGEARLTSSSLCASTINKRAKAAALASRERSGEATAAAPPLPASPQARQARQRHVVAIARELACFLWAAAVAD
jgi:hypothetical protein